MDFVIQLSLLSDTEMIAMVFLIIGILVYLVDYKKFNRMPDNRREAHFSNAVAHTYIWGSLGMMVGLHVLGWVS